MRTLVRTGGDGPPAIDPRFVQRWNDVEQSNRRRRRLLVEAVATVVGLLSASFLVLHSPLFSVHGVEVGGSVHTPKGVVVNRSGLSSGPAMVSVNPAVVRARVESLPWVGEVTVRRQWPSTVELTIVERTPVAQVKEDKGGWALVDRTGRILALERVPRANLITLGGFHAARSPGARLEASGSAALAVVRSLPAYLGGRISSVVSAGGGVDLTLAPAGPTVLLGTATDLGQKYESLLTVMQRVSLSGVKTVDLRVPQDPALTPG